MQKTKTVREKFIRVYDASYVHYPRCLGEAALAQVSAAWLSSSASPTCCTW